MPYQKPSDSWGNTQAKTPLFCRSDLLIAISGTKLVENRITLKQVVFLPDFYDCDKVSY